jgi:hypothetical protein
VRRISASISLVPHIDGASGAGANGNAQHRNQRLHRVKVPRRQRHPDDSGENHQRHNPGLQGLDIIGDGRPGSRHQAHAGREARLGKLRHGGPLGC